MNRFLVVVASTFCLASSLAAEDQVDIPRIQRALKSQNWQERLRASQESGKLGVDGKPLLRELCTMVVSRSAEQRQAGMEAIEQIDPDLYAVLLPIVANRERNQRIEDIERLAKLEEQAEPAVPIVLERMRIGEQKEIIACVSALIEIAPKDPLLAKVIVDLATRHRNSAVRETALSAIPGLDRTPQSVARYVALLDKSARLENRDNQIVCIKGLASFGDAAQDAIPTLRKLKGSPHENVRNSANQAITQIEDALGKKQP